MLDAVSEADGHVEWSWTPPANDSSFHRNIVVTRNLLFVSTDMNVYATDIMTWDREGLDRRRLIVNGLLEGWRGFSD